MKRIPYISLDPVTSYSSGRGYGNVKSPLGPYFLTPINELERTLLVHNTYEEKEEKRYNTKIQRDYLSEINMSSTPYRLFQRFYKQNIN